MRLFIDVSEDKAELLKKGLKLNNTALAITLQAFLLEAVDTFTAANFGLCPSCGLVFRKSVHNQKNCNGCKREINKVLKKGD